MFNLSSGLIKHCRGQAPHSSKNISIFSSLCWIGWIVHDAVRPSLKSQLDWIQVDQFRLFVFVRSSCGSPSIRSYYQNLLLFVRCLEFDFSSVPSGACTRSACTVSSGAVSLCLICLILCSFRFFLAQQQRVVISRSLVFARACSLLLGEIQLQ